MRVKGGTKSKNRRKRVLKKTEGFTGRARNTLVTATEALDRAMAFNYRDRKVLKRNIRSLWITRLTAAARAHGTSYSRLINALKTKKIDLNRKMLADLAATEPKVFTQILKVAGLAS
ncbi:MAG: 50S ribosomal protein L20 [Deltaproteobacteria bacterium]|nr:50S ribosomal protein L20 [Deltaproteobacteria bacterium]